MGTLTTNFKIYKPDPTESVDVEKALNSALRTIDREAHLLMEYGLTDTASITSDPNIEKKVGYKWYKPFSNSQWYWTGSAVTQDNIAHVDTWVSMIPYLAAGFKAVPGREPFYSIVSSSGGTTQIWLDGAIKKTDDTNIVKNTTNVVFTGLPTAIRPTVSKYFITEAGNTTANYSISRTFVKNDGNIEIHRYGDIPVISNEYFVDLGGIHYNKEVAA